MKKIVFVIKRLVISLCMLYAFDVIVSSAGVMIPINAITVTSVACLGMPGIFGLFILQNFM